MKLITKEIERRLPPLYSNEGTPADQVPIVAKFFTPDGSASWFITEGNLQTGMLFGLCDLGFGFPELGYITLQELEETRGRLGLPVERDRHYGNHFLSEVLT